GADQCDVTSAELSKYRARVENRAVLAIFEHAPIDRTRMGSVFVGHIPTFLWLTAKFSPGSAIETNDDMSEQKPAGARRKRTFCPVQVENLSLMINSFVRVQKNALGADTRNVLTFDFRFAQNDTIK